MDVHNIWGNLYLCSVQRPEVDWVALSESSCACHEYYDDCSICRAVGSNHYSKQHSLVSASREKFMCFLIAKLLAASQQPNMFHNNSQICFTFIISKKGCFNNSPQTLIFKKICLSVSIILEWVRRNLNITFNLLACCCDQKAPLTKSIKLNESTTL